MNASNAPGHRAPRAPAVRGAGRVDAAGVAEPGGDAVHGAAPLTTATGPLLHTAKPSAQPASAWPPLPSWPYWLPPQQAALPSASTAQVWAQPPLGDAAAWANGTC